MKKQIVVVTKYCTIKFEFDQVTLRKLKRLAAHFGYPVEEFVQRYVVNTLPGQRERKRPWKRDAKVAAALARVIADASPDAHARIKRAASLYEYGDVARLIWDTIGSSVRCSEEDMLLSPKTGKVIGDRLHVDIDRYAISRRLHSEAA